MFITPKSHAYFAAFLILATALLTWYLLCFLSTITLNRSKSLNCRLASLAAIFLAHADAPHWASTSACFQYFSTVPERAPRGSLEMRIGVKVT